MIIFLFLTHALMETFSTHKMQKQKKKKKTKTKKSKEKQVKTYV